MGELFEQNKREFKAKTAIALHDINIPVPEAMGLEDYVKAKEIKHEFEEFIRSIQQKLEELS